MIFTKNTYNYRMKVFTMATSCVEFNLAPGKVQQIAEIYNLDKTDLSRACYVLRTQSVLLRKLVELGLWSLSDAKDFAKEFFQRPRLQYVSDESAKLFDDELREFLEITSSSEHVDRLADFFIEQAEGDGQYLGCLLKSLLVKVNESYRATESSGKNDGIKLLTETTPSSGQFVLPCIDDLYDRDGNASDADGNLYYDAKGEPITITRMLDMIEAHSGDVN